MKWDAHEDLRANHGKNARVLDKRTAALLKDLEPRGLLDEDAGRVHDRVRPSAHQ